MPAYVPLWCKTDFSFLEGAAHPEELIEHARAIGLDTLAISDCDGVQGIVRAHVARREHDVRIVIGSEITVRDGSTVVLLARNRAGYANLCRLVAAGHLRSAKGTSVVEPAEVAARAAGLCALWTGSPADPTYLKDAFDGRLYALITRHRRDDEPPREARQCATAKRLGTRPSPAARCCTTPAPTVRRATCWSASVKA